MENYKPNSIRSKKEETAEERKKVEKVVSGAVTTRKKTGVRKLADVFITEDIHNVKNYIIMDVLIPTIRDAIEDIVTKGIRMVLRGEASARSGHTRADTVSYRKYYDEKRGTASTTRSEPRTLYSYKDLVVETRPEAEEVLAKMQELIDEYGSVSVLDLYDLCGETASHTDNNYGWYDLRNARAVRIREGYVFDLPKVMPLR